MARGNEEVVYKRGNSSYYIDSSGNEVMIVTHNNLVSHATTADPATPVVGEMWFRTDL